MSARNQQVCDVNGRELIVGDTVVTVDGSMTGTISALDVESGVPFVRLRPLHQPYSKGLWDAADRVVWLSRDKKKAEQANAPVGGLFSATT